MTSINSELSIGRKGEIFFKDKLAYPLFFDEMAMKNILLTGKRFLDNITECNKEGDFRLIDGTLVEVKTLVGPYNNVLIEYARGKDIDREGWYQHCKRNGVDFIVWNRYRSKVDLYPVYSILVGFLALSEYIDSNTIDPRWFSGHMMRPMVQTDSKGRKDVFHNLKIDCDELFYDARCVMQIVYPRPSETRIEDILARKAAPPWQGLTGRKIYFPWE